MKYISLVLVTFATICAQATTPKVCQTHEAYEAEIKSVEQTLANLNYQMSATRNQQIVITLMAQFTGLADYRMDLITEQTGCEANTVSTQ